MSPDVEKPPPITRILVPVDLTERSLDAAAYAMSLADRFGSSLVFVHGLGHGWPLDPAEREIRDRIQAMPRAPQILFREDAPVPVILETAEAAGCDLILMPDHGKPALARLFDGSVTAQVLRRALCPVWVGFDDAVPFPMRPIRSILCGLALGPRAEAVLRWSSHLARHLNASLALVHASSALEPNPGYRCDPEWRFRLRTMAREDIEELQARIGTRVDVWLEAGRPLEAIPSLAESLGAGLVVVGKSPEKRFLGDLRTLTYEIACRTPCPVASV